MARYLDELYSANVKVTRAMFRRCNGREESEPRHTVIVDLAISVDIRLAYHLVDFRIREFFACTQKTITSERRTTSVHCLL